MADVRTEPYGAFNFLVEIDGVTQASFMEVSGFEVEVDVIDYRTGDAKTLGVRKLPGLVKYGNIVMKRGITLDHSLCDWMRKAIEGAQKPANMTMMLLDEQ